jgi:hypothetical protein
MRHSHSLGSARGYAVAGDTSDTSPVHLSSGGRFASVPVRRIWALLLSLVIVAGLLTATAIEASARAPHAPAVSAGQNVLAQKYLSAEKGGTVRAANGAALYVPRGVLRKNSWARISKLPAGRYNVHIYGTWKHKVRVTMPGNSKTVVEHKVNGRWRVESTSPGQRTVWVSHLSPFGPLACLVASGGVKGKLMCFVKKGVKALPTTLLKKFAKSMLDRCGVGSGLLTVPLALLLDPNCTAQAGEGDYNPPAPAPAPVYATGQIHISPCLNLRAGPHKDYALIGCVPDGTTIGIECVGYGNPVTGPWSTTSVWDRITYAGTTGYVADAYVWTGTDNPVAPAC